MCLFLILRVEVFDQRIRFGFRLLCGAVNAEKSVLRKLFNQSVILIAVSFHFKIILSVSYFNRFLLYNILAFNTNRNFSVFLHFLRYPTFPSHRVYFLQHHPSYKCIINRCFDHYRTLLKLAR